MYMPDVAEAVEEDEVAGLPARPCEATRVPDVPERAEK